MEFDKYIAERLREATQDGPDAVLDAVGIEAYGSPGAQLLQQATGLLPDKVAQLAMGKGLGGPHRGAACGGVYAGPATPMPMLELFDKQIQLRSGQCNVTGRHSYCRSPRTRMTRGTGGVRMTR